MPPRRTKGIVTDHTASDPAAEADVIMTAAALGFAADHVATTGGPIQFDIDPLDASDPKERERTALFESTMRRMDTAVAAHLARTGRAPGGVHAGLCPGYWQGAMIMGVYRLAGREAPPALAAPVLSPKGRALWDRIRTASPSIRQYTGRGAYTGFVDNKNTEGDTDPVGPRSTVRMAAPAESPRWLPPEGHPLWRSRTRKDGSGRVPWGLIGGGRATHDPAPPNPSNAANLADQIEREMRDVYGMVFVGPIGDHDVAGYTHGMIQAIYKAYTLGPSCEPYEIAVGDQTKKMASCLPCTMFMHAAGYPPTSVHLGSGESWAPLFAPYSPNGPTAPNEAGVVRDLNDAWYARCLEWLGIGVDVLDDARVTDDHRTSRDALRDYLRVGGPDRTLGGMLILDALTMHEPELNRLARTLR